MFSNSRVKHYSSSFSVCARKGGSKGRGGCSVCCVCVSAHIFDMLWKTSLSHVMCGWGDVLSGWAGCVEGARACWHAEKAWSKGKKRRAVFLPFGKKRKGVLRLREQKRKGRKEGKSAGRLSQALPLSMSPKKQNRKRIIHKRQSAAAGACVALRCAGLGHAGAPAYPLSLTSIPTH